LAPGAKAEINIDSQTMELTKQNMKNPTRLVPVSGSYRIFFRAPDFVPALFFSIF
jgi:hypothetical protein